MTKEKAKELFNPITYELFEEEAKEHLRSEVNTYDEYLTGQVYGYRVYKVDEEGNEEEDECIEGCWGFFGQAGIKEIIAEATQYIKQLEAA
jgi:hypothetical protein